MNINIAPGTYVVAVSGGVDSMVLLDVLRQQPGVKLIVAHFDHGIRHDSRSDRELVQQTAKSHSLPFVYHEGKLGPAASEDEARIARYAFLHAVKDAARARAIVTAHHHNDALETAIINMMRGTGRKGLSALSSTEALHRPLLHLTKEHIHAYARDQGLVWREDSTNQDTRYLRNYVRHKLLAQFTEADRHKLRDIIAHIEQTNRELDTELVHYLHVQPALDRLSRHEFVRLPHAVAKEVMATWLRRHGIRDFDQKMLERLVVGAKTYQHGKKIDVVKGRHIHVSRHHLALR